MFTKMHAASATYRSRLVRWGLMILTALGLSIAVNSQDDSKVDEQVKELWSAQHAARSAFWRDRSRMEWEYRKKLAAMISQADRAEVFLLDFAIPDVEPEAVTGIETFPIEPYGKDTRIIKKISVDKAGLLVLKKATAKALAGKAGEGGVLCHYPIHGIRLSNGAGIIFETSLCWICGNYYVQYPDSCNWNEMGDGFGELHELLDKLLPVPQSELDRFKALQQSSK